MIAVKLSTSFATQIAVDIATTSDSPLNLFSCTIMPNNNLPQSRHITGSEAKYVVDGLTPGVNYTVKCTASFNGIQSCESVSNSLGMKDICNIICICSMHNVYFNDVYMEYAPDLD